MKVTLSWLKEKRACNEAIEAWFAHGKEPEPIKVAQLAMSMGRFDWANWLVVRCMKYKQYVSYAVFAAEQVIDIYEKQYPGDNKPRKAIEAAKRCIAKKSKKNIAYAYAAAVAAAYAVAAADAADAVDAAANAAYAANAANAANAAYAAAYAVAAADAADAAYVADAAAYAVAAADAAYAVDAVDAAKNKKGLQRKIIEYGCSLLEDRTMKVVHADHGASTFLQISGRHTIAVCGQWLQDANPANDNRKTQDDAKVTCKKCKNLLSGAR